ncbi:HET domain containing protein [Hyaloscypha variabilis]
MCLVQRSVFACKHSTIDTDVCQDQRKIGEKKQSTKSGNNIEFISTCENYSFEERILLAESCLFCVYRSRLDGLGQKVRQQLEPCAEPHCKLEAGHFYAKNKLCDIDSCGITEGHLCLHLFQFEPRQELQPTLSPAAQVGARLHMLNLLVLSNMGPLFQQFYHLEIAYSINSINSAMVNLTPSIKIQAKQTFKGTSGTTFTAQVKRPKPEGNYSRLHLSQKEIRLFELLPKSNGEEIQGSFVYADLSNCPAYTALSYTWGEPKHIQMVKLHGSNAIKVRSNLSNFLCQQAATIDTPKLFWIDAICIDQDNIHERNHQVNLMKEIYANATDMHIWLGNEADESDIAMDFIREKAALGLKPKGIGFRTPWRRDEGKALCELFERPYWRRMWIIQEVAHAQKITVGCGSKTFDWECLETLYLTLKKIEDTGWFAHQQHAINILQSSAFVMVWQRAYWRHPQTPTPALKDLIELFQGWKCTDVRDKVFALINMATLETRINPDYSLTARDIYFAVQAKHPSAKPQFFNLLSQVLGVRGRDVNFHSPSLVEYKVQPVERILLKWNREKIERGVLSSQVAQNDVIFEEKRQNKPLF